MRRGEDEEMKVGEGRGTEGRGPTSVSVNFSLNSVCCVATL